MSKMKNFVARIMGKSKNLYSSDNQQEDVSYKVLASSFLDNNTVKILTPITNEMALFHSDLAKMLSEHNGVRQWEYGMMLLGISNWANKKVLDIGSGPSFLPIYLSRKKNAQVSVLDLPAPFTIEYEKMLDRFSEENISLNAGDMRDMPFEDEHFDIVTSISVIEHLSHSPDHKVMVPRDVFFQETKKTLQEMYRILCPGGWIYLTSDAFIPRMAKNDNWGKKLFDGEPYGAYSIDILKKIFIQTFEELGAHFPYPIKYDANLLLHSSRYASYRNRYMTVFNLFVQKPDLP